MRPRFGVGTKAELSNKASDIKLGAPVAFLLGIALLVLREAIAENDFVAAGGDGYPVFSARATSQGIMDQVVADYITAKGTVSPALQGWIACTGSGCPALTNPC